MGDGSCFENSRVCVSIPWGFESLSFRFQQFRICASDRAAKVPGFHPGQAGSTPARHLRGSFRW